MEVESGVVGEANPEPCSVLAVLCSHGGLEMNHLASGYVGTWSIVGAAFLDGFTALRGFTNFEALNPSDEVVNVFKVDGIDLEEVAGFFTTATLVWEGDIDVTTGLKKGGGMNSSPGVFAGIPISGTTNLEVTVI